MLASGIKFMRVQLRLGSDLPGSIFHATASWMPRSLQLVYCYKKIKISPEFLLHLTPLLDAYKFVEFRPIDTHLAYLLRDHLLSTPPEHSASPLLQGRRRPWEWKGISRPGFPARLGQTGGFAARNRVKG